MTLQELLDRVKAATGPDREVDAAIGEFAASEFVQRNNWKLATIGADYDGNNACEFYTSDGKLVEGFGYPNKGKVHQFYHVPHEVRFGIYTASIDAALALTERVLPGSMISITQMLSHWQASILEMDPEHADAVVSDWVEDALSAPLAILAATLSALIAKEAGE